MRRLAAVLPATFAALTLLAVPALAEGGHHSEGTSGSSSSASEHHGEHGDHHKKPRRVELVGVISDTPTATIATPSSDTATSTITIDVKGGHRAEHGVRHLVITLNKDTVVRRNGPATASDLKLGDLVTVKARHLDDGSWLALRVNAHPARPAKRHDDD